MNKISIGDRRTLGLPGGLAPGFRLLAVHLKHIEAGEFFGKNLKDPFWRYYVNMEKGVVVESGSDRVDMPAYRDVLIAPNTDYEMVCDKPLYHLYIHFVMQPPYADAESGVYALDESKERRALVKELAPMIIREDKADKTVLLKIAALLSSALCRLPAAVFHSGEYRDPRVERVCAYISENLSESVDNSRLASLANMQVNAFCRFFKEKVGVTPHRFVMAKRVELACQLLHDADLSIDQIAAATGFSDRFHFSRVFLREQKQTPVKYRRVILGVGQGR